MALHGARFKFIIMAYTTEFKPFEGKKTVGNLTSIDGEFSFTASVNLDVQETLDDYKEKLKKAHEAFLNEAKTDLSKVETFLNK